MDSKLGGGKKEREKKKVNLSINERSLVKSGPFLIRAFHNQSRACHPMIFLMHKLLNSRVKCAFTRPSLVYKHDDAYVRNRKYKNTDNCHDLIIRFFMVNGSLEDVCGFIMTTHIK